jgi:hypothetical protein
MKYINISTKTHPNTFTMVDDTDFDWLNQWKWGVDAKSNTSYAKRAGESQECIQMHRLILGLTDKKVVTDHINGNGLDNRRSNLRACSQAENLKNQKESKNNTSGYKGVYWNKVSNKWYATISVNSKDKYLGSFTCLIKAAKCFDEAAIKYRGEFAKLNFPATPTLSSIAKLLMSARSDIVVHGNYVAATSTISLALDEIAKMEGGE